MTPASPAYPRVLIATADHALDRQIANTIVRRRYYTEFAAETADVLRTLMAPDPPEIAVLGSGNVDIAAEAKRLSRTKQTWIILMTQAAGPEFVSLAGDAGVDDVILYEPSGPEGKRMNEVDLLIRLGVAIRVQEIRRQLGFQLQPAESYGSRDALTRVWDRDSLVSLLFVETDRVQRMGTPLAILLLDLDHFGRMGIEYGTVACDNILQEIAERLRRSLRSYDLLGRSGNDEFLIALPGCNSAQALEFASRIRTVQLQHPFAVSRDLITITASIGVAQSRGRSPLVVLREAERALAIAKLDGRNCEREFRPLQPPKTLVAAVGEDVDCVNRPEPAPSL